MFQILALAALALTLAIGGGTASVWYALETEEGFGAQRIGPWTVDLAERNIEDNPYALARRARDAQLPLGIAEGMTFHARSDEEGRPLAGNCAYVLEGNMPVARLWTLHVDNGAGPAVGDDAPAGLHSRQILRRPDGSFQISVSARIMPGNWIEAPRNGPFTLVLTLFDTPVASTLRVTEQAYPAIRRTDCG